MDRSQPHRNVELKAVDRDPARSLAACEALGAEARGTRVQRDTYFRVARGRLKLREEEGAVAQLIAYERPDRPGGRESRYRIVPVGEPDGLRAALGETLGVRAVVAKRRRLFLWEAVRIHLDRVEGLGDFLELEAVAPAGSDLSAERRRVGELCEALAIAEEDLVAVGYADLMLAREGAG